MATVLSDDIGTFERDTRHDDELTVENSGAAQNERTSNNERTFSPEPIGLSKRQEILVPVSGKNESKTRELVNYAASLARKYSMKIVLVCAIPDLQMPDEYMQYAKTEGISDYYAYYIEGMSAQILGKWEALLDAQGIEYDVVTHVGSIRNAIRETMSSHKIGIVLVKPEGSRKGLINRILHPSFLGPIPYRVSAESHTPVLVVP